MSSTESSDTNVSIWDTFRDWLTHQTHIFSSVQVPKRPSISRITECLLVPNRRQQQLQEHHHHQQQQDDYDEDVSKTEFLYSWNQPTPTVLLYGTTNAEEHYRQIHTWFMKLSQVKNECDVQFSNMHKEGEDGDRIKDDTYEEIQRYRNWISQHILYRMGFQYKLCTPLDPPSFSSSSGIHEKDTSSHVNNSSSYHSFKEDDEKKEGYSTNDMGINEYQHTNHNTYNQTTNDQGNNLNPILSSYPTQTQLGNQTSIPMDSFISFSSYSSTTSLSSYGNNTCSYSSFSSSPPISINETLQTRLVHIPSNTIITEENRKLYIADGPMYEEMATLCQDYAQYVMSQEGSLQWTLLSTYKENIMDLENEVVRPSTTTNNNNNIYRSTSHDPILALIYSHPSNTSTLIISTGKGKVKAGIFSRRHLLTSSIEVSTAWTFIHEARKRSMNIIVLDPNAHGDMYGMETFTLSMNRLLNVKDEETVGNNSNPILGQQQHPPPTRRRIGMNNDLDISLPWYILSHSASGTQWVRYIMEKSMNTPTSFVLPQAIVFTDSTHHIQWVKQNIQLYDWLQSSHCLYIRSFHSQNGYDEEGEQQAQVVGNTCPVDSYWKHRFGNIQTVWAGTKDHSLSNWYARDVIWSHFDHYR